jgi:hypothetical protein
MAIIRTFEHLDGYVVQVKEYVLNIPIGTYDNLMERLDEHRDIKPELFGFLLGKAEPVYEKVVCEQCKKHIKEKEEYKTRFGESIYALVPLHKKCAKKRKKKPVLPM